MANNKPKNIGSSLPHKVTRLRSIARSNGCSIPPDMEGFFNLALQHQGFIIADQY